MPRRSGAELAQVRVNVRRERLRPPAALDKAERTVFHEVVGALAPEHFNAGDVVLLVRYCEAAVLAARAAKELRRRPVVGAKVSPWLVVLEKADRSLATLALRLRICPQSRDHARTAGRRAQGVRPSIMDLVRGGDDDDAT